MPNPFIIVAGLGHCGTSLLMQILDAGGVPCLGQYPAFECDEVNHRAVPMRWLAEHPGHAFKLLNPQLCPLPPVEDMGTALVFWLDRDPREQAKSSAKFSRATLGVRTNRRGRRQIERSLRDDRGVALATLREHQTAVLSFEQFMIEPDLTVARIAATLERWFPDFDIAAARRQIIDRPATCRPDLAIERQLMESRR